MYCYDVRELKWSIQKQNQGLDSSSSMARQCPASHISKKYEECLETINMGIIQLKEKNK